MVQPGLKNQLGQQFWDSYMEPSPEIDEVSRFSASDCCRPQYFDDHTPNSKYKRVSFIVPTFFVFKT